MKIFPRHTLGAYSHSENRVTELESQFEGARNAEYLRKLYYGAPARSGSNELSTRSNIWPGTMHR